MNSQNENYTKELLKLKYNNFPFLTEPEQETLISFFLENKAIVNELPNLYSSIADEMEKCATTFSDLALEKNVGNTYTLSFLDYKIDLDKEYLLELLSSTYDIMQEVLPLGSVVELKQEIIQPFLEDGKTVEHPLFIITHRFISPKGAAIYTPYAGVVFPIGVVEEAKALHFPHAAIEKVIHCGYSNEQEEAFVFLMKNEMIVDSGFKSVGFATNNELKLFELSMQRGV